MILFRFDQDVGKFGLREQDSAIEIPQMKDHQDSHTRRLEQVDQDQNDLVREDDLVMPAALIFKDSVVVEPANV